MSLIRKSLAHYGISAEIGKCGEVFMNKCKLTILFIAIQVMMIQIRR